MAIVKKSITTNSRVVNDLLTKYRNTFQAFTELINNSLQADAKDIYIDIEYAGDSVSKSPFLEISISDNGHGVPYSKFENTILEIGTRAKETGHGIGRFAALQIGHSMSISTVGYEESSGKYTKTSFKLDSTILNDTKLSEIEFDIDYEILSGNHNTGYKVVIQELIHNQSNKTPKRNKLTEDFLADKIKQAIFEHYPYEIFNAKNRFWVNKELLDKSQFIDGSPNIIKPSYTDKKGQEHNVSFYFYKVKMDISKVKVYFQANNAGLKSIAHEFTYTSDWYTDDLGTWFIYVESTLFDTDLFRNIDIETLGETRVTHFKNFVKDQINEFFKAKNKRFEKHVARLKSDSFYPYQDGKTVLSLAQEAVFNKITYLIEDEYELLKRELKIRGFVYSLLDKAIADGHITEIFEKVLKLSNENLQKFHQLLEKTELEDVVQFSNQVAEKIEFIDFFHELTYGDISKILKERSQLHKIVEKNLWLFGEQYNGTPHLWSDKKIGNILTEIRNSHFNYEPSETDENLIALEGEGLNDITDLFFFNEKVLDNGKKEIMVVELKSPKCAIGQKEISQIDKYAYTIENNSGLATEDVTYKLILVSSRLNNYAKSKMKSSREKYSVPFLYDKKTEKNIEVFIIEWSELIEMNKRKLGYLSSKLNVKDKSVKTKFEQEYGELIDTKVSAQLRKVG